MGENQRIFIITSQTMSKLTKNICDLSATDIVWVLTFSEEDQNLAASLELASDTFNIISCEIYNNKKEESVFRLIDSNINGMVPVYFIGNDLRSVWEMYGEQIALKVRAGCGHHNNFNVKKLGQNDFIKLQKNTKQKKTSLDDDGQINIHQVFIMQSLATMPQNNPRNVEQEKHNLPKYKNQTDKSEAEKTEVEKTGSEDAQAKETERKPENQVEKKPVKRKKRPRPTPGKAEIPHQSIPKENESDGDTQTGDCSVNEETEPGSVSEAESAEKEAKSSVKNANTDPEQKTETSKNDNETEPGSVSKADDTKKTTTPKQDQNTSEKESESEKKQNNEIGNASGTQNASEDTSEFCDEVVTYEEKNKLFDLDVEKAKGIICTYYIERFKSHFLGFKLNECKWLYAVINNEDQFDQIIYEIIVLLLKARDERDFNDSWNTGRDGLEITLNGEHYKTLKKEAIHYKNTVSILYGQDDEFEAKQY